MRRPVTVHLVLQVLAVVLFLVFAAIADNVIHSDEGFVVLGFGLASFAASFI